MDQPSPLSASVAGIEEVAQAMGRPVDWLKRNWLKQHEQNGMPRKHPSAWIWPRNSMRVWLTNHQGAELSISNDNDQPLLTPHEARVETHQQLLRARYGRN